jgi:hypothetical protein
MARSVHSLWPRAVLEDSANHPLGINDRTFFSELAETQSRIHHDAHRDPQPTGGVLRWLGEILINRVKPMTAELPDEEKG